MVVIGGVVGILVAVTMALGLHMVFAQVAEPEGVKGETKTVTEVNSRYYMAVVLGAALAAGFGFLGGGYAVARVGAAALGAASERPELLVRSLVFVALGEGIAIFGLVVAILLVLRLPA
jgi:V/A-type H+-transporting ATPase subunit K